MNDKEPAPTKNSGPYVWDLVFADMHERDNLGLKTYGTRLQPFNGRNALKDLTEELLDAIVYLRQHMEEMKCLGTEITEVRNALVESQSLEKEDCVRLADLLTQSLRKNPALNAE